VPTEHVAFVHGWLGCHLVSADDPNRVYWGDQPITYLTTILRHRRMLTDLRPPRALVPGRLNQNYRTFVEGLGLLGFHNEERERQSVFTYDWRLGAAEASTRLNAHLNKVPSSTSIVAHSYGGLVVLYALAAQSVSDANLAKIKQVIIIATPYLGTTFALLGLSKSGDFMRRASEFLPGALKALFVVLNNSPDFLTERLAPTFGSFQSLYDMIPHDLNVDDLKVLKVPGLREPVTSFNWPFLTANRDARAMRKEARRVQKVIREATWPVPVVSIMSDTEDTAHRCVVGPGPRWALAHAPGAGDVPGDGIVAACCTFPAPESRRHRLIWSDRLDSPTSHNKLLHHPKTHELLRELLQ
jgi:pimeloyl-ACP methyl ester carboxylesterase